MAHNKYLKNLEKKAFKEGLQKQASRNVTDKVAESIFEVLSGTKCSSCGNVIDESIGFCERCG